MSEILDNFDDAKIGELKSNLDSVAATLHDHRFLWPAEKSLRTTTKDILNLFSALLNERNSRSAPVLQGDAALEALAEVIGPAIMSAGGGDVIGAVRYMIGALADSRQSATSFAKESADRGQEILQLTEALEIERLHNKQLRGEEENQPPFISDSP